MQTKTANDNYLAADIANLLAHVDALLVAYPELADDEDLRNDMLEGETSVREVLTRVVGIEREADALAKAIAGRISDLQSRKARAEKRKEAMRAFLLRIMQATGTQKAVLTEATVSVTKGRDSVEVTDEAKLPDNVVRVVRTPDKGLIKEALATGPVEGARMVTGEPTVSVRVG